MFQWSSENIGDSDWEGPNQMMFTLPEWPTIASENLGINPSGQWDILTVHHKILIDVTFIGNYENLSYEIPVRVLAASIETLDDLIQNHAQTLLSNWALRGGQDETYATLLLKSPEVIFVSNHQATELEINQKENFLTSLDSSRNDLSKRLDPSPEPPIYDLDQEMRHRVTVPYYPMRDDEIILEYDDLIHVVKYFDDGWCLGSNLRSGQSGIFPGNSLSNELGTSLKMKVFRVIADHETRSQGELELNVDDLVEVRELTSENWGIGRSIKTQKEGRFRLNVLSTAEIEPLVNQRSLSASTTLANTKTNISVASESFAPSRRVTSILNAAERWHYINANTIESEKSHSLIHKSTVSSFSTNSSTMAPMSSHRSEHAKSVFKKSWYNSEEEQQLDLEKINSQTFTSMDGSFLKIPMPLPEEITSKLADQRALFDEQSFPLSEPILSNKSLSAAEDQFRKCDEYFSKLFSEDFITETEYVLRRNLLEQAFSFQPSSHSELSSSKPVTNAIWSVDILAALSGVPSEIFQQMDPRTKFAIVWGSQYPEGILQILLSVVSMNDISSEYSDSSEKLLLSEELLNLVVSDSNLYSSKIRAISEMHDDFELLKSLRIFGDDLYLEDSIFMNLTDEKIKDSTFLIRISEAHSAMARKCLYVLNSYFETQMSQNNIPKYVRYACINFWMHLEISRDQLLDFRNFIMEHCLHWIELSARCNVLSKVILASITMFTIIQELELGPSFSSLLSVLSDVVRVIKTLGKVLLKDPMQIYYCAVPFAPTKSEFRNLFINKIPKGSPEVTFNENNFYWPPCIATYTQHEMPIKGIASLGKGQFVSCDSKRINIWSIASSYPIKSIQQEGIFALGKKGMYFLQQSGKSFFVRSVDTREVISEFEVTMKNISALEFDFDDATYICGNEDGLIIVSKDKLLRKLITYNGEVTTLSLNPNNTTFASGHSDGTIYLFSLTHQTKRIPFYGSKSAVNSIMFLEGSRLVSVNKSTNVTIWNSELGNALQSLNLMKGTLTFSISSDGLFVFTGDKDRNVNVWSTKELFNLNNVKSFEVEPTKKDFIKHVQSLRTKSRYLKEKLSQVDEDSNFSDYGSIERPMFRLSIENLTSMNSNQDSYFNTSVTNSPSLTSMDSIIPKPTQLYNFDLNPVPQIRSIDYINEFLELFDPLHREIEMHCKEYVRYLDRTHNWLKATMDQFLKRKEHRILWLKGLDDKTFASCVIANYLKENNQLGGIFIGHMLKDPGYFTTRRLLGTLVYFLAMWKYDYGVKILVLSRQKLIPDMNLGNVDELFETLIAKPLQDIEADINIPEEEKSFVLILDAFEEFNNQSLAFINLIKDNYQKLPAFVKIFITSNTDEFPLHSAIINDYNRMNIEMNDGCSLSDILESSREYFKKEKVDTSHDPKIMSESLKELSAGSIVWLNLAYKILNLRSKSEIQLDSVKSLPPPEFIFGMSFGFDKMIECLLWCLLYPVRDEKLPIWPVISEIISSERILSIAEVKDRISHVSRDASRIHVVLGVLSPILLVSQTDRIFISYPSIRDFLIKCSEKYNFEINSSKISPWIKTPTIDSSLGSPSEFSLDLARSPSTIQNVQYFEDDIIGSGSFSKVYKS
ncbi:hypothetical protein HK096_007457, partial [Nowakowskiella sp. JEL0078]